MFRTSTSSGSRLSRSVRKRADARSTREGDSRTGRRSLPSTSRFGGRWSIDQHHRRRIAIVVVRLATTLTAIAILVGACGTTAPDPSRNSIESIPFRGTAGWDWIDNDTLLVSRLVDVTSLISPHDLFVVTLSTGSWRPLNLPQPRECERTDYLRPTRSLDGEMVAVRQCIPVVVTSNWPTSIVAIDTATGGVTDRTSNLAHGSVINVSSFAWDDATKSGIASVGDVICQGLQAVSESGLSGLPATVSDGNQGFRLDADPEPGATDCSTGRADTPTLRSDGTLAFSASVDAVGHQGPSRLDAPSSIYSVRPSDTEAMPIFSGVTGILGLDWSPDGRCLVFGGTIVDRNPATTVVAVRDGTTRTIADEAWGPKWSPDGRRIAGDSESGSLSVIMTSETC
jgi:hypothetical protein